MSLTQTERPPDGTNKCKYRTVPAGVADHQQDNWVEWLPDAEYTANNAALETTTLTQFFVVHCMNLQINFRLNQQNVSSPNV